MYIIYNTDNEQMPQLDTENSPYIPILDDPITCIEVEKAIRTIKNKGYIGVCVGLFRWLPRQWVDLFAVVFNLMFASSEYPDSWRTSLLILIKSGSRALCGNYTEEYQSWIVWPSCTTSYSTTDYPNAAQAGAQKGRGCMEQILTLRLLIENARLKKELFIKWKFFEKKFHVC